MSIFKVGDVVIFVGPESARALGQMPDYGKVVDVIQNDIGVDFGQDVTGHDCRGKCIYGYGWYFDEKDLQNVLVMEL